MKNFSQIKSTLVGLALISAGLYTGVTGKADWAMSSIIITAGLPYLFANDDMLKKKSK